MKTKTTTFKSDRDGILDWQRLKYILLRHCGRVRRIFIGIFLSELNPYRLL